MCKRGNESEDTEQELILPRVAPARRVSVNKALREVSLLAALPRDTLAALTPAQCRVDQDFHTHYLV